MSHDPRRSRRVVGVVSALGAAQSVAIVTQISAIGDAVGASIFGAGATAALVISLLSSVFLAVAITVTGVVVAGAAEIVLLGELRPIALRRLIGATAAEERRRMTRHVLGHAAKGMALGALAGYAVSIAVLTIGLAGSRQLDVRAGMLLPSPLLLLALGAQFVVTRGAITRGTAGVLRVRPLDALRTAADADRAVPATLGVAPRASTATLLIGLVVLASAVALSTRSPLAMLPAVAGGVISFVGIASCASRFVPALVDGLARLLPQRLPVQLARRSLASHPARTSRAVMGVAAAVTLVTTFAVGITSFEHAVDEHYDGSAVAGLAADVLDAVVGVVAVLTVFLAVTAGVALSHAVSFEAWLRRRDTALLRILGQPARGVRATQVMQSLVLVLAAVVVGVVLGIGYGWIGAQSVFAVEAPGGVVDPVLPWPVLLVTVLAAGVLTLVAAVLPARATLRTAPIRAYLAT